MKNRLDKSGRGWMFRYLNGAATHRRMAWLAAAMLAEGMYRHPDFGKAVLGNHISLAKGYLKAASFQRRRPSNRLPG